MALSDNLLRLANRAREAEDRFEAAKTQGRNQVEEHVEQAREKSQTTMNKLRTDVTTATGQAEAWGDGIQRSWTEHVAHVRDRIDARKTRHESKVAERYAEDAQKYAEFTIDFAYSAIEEAEYAVLDAVLTQLDADEAAASTAS
jgi:hypothetical protein